MCTIQTMALYLVSYFPDTVKQDGGCSLMLIPTAAHSRCYVLALADVAVKTNIPALPSLLYFSFLSPGCLTDVYSGASVVVGDVCGFSCSP